MRNDAISNTSTTASVYFVSSPTPTATPSSGHEPRPSASRSASQRTTIVVSWSNATGWNKQVGRQHPRHEPDEHRGERLRPPRGTELASYERGDQHGRRAGQDREGAQTDERPAKELPSEGRQQGRHRRKLDIPALQVQARNRVVQLVAMPAVPSGDGQLQRALQGDDDQHRAGRERDRGLLCGLARHDPASLEPDPSGRGAAVAARGGRRKGVRRKAERSRAARGSASPSVPPAPSAPAFPAPRRSPTAH